MTDCDLFAGSSSAVEELVRAAMGAGAMCIMEKAAAGQIDPRASLGEALGDFPAEFVKIRSGLVADVVAELAAQRPPLGYAALLKRDPSDTPHLGAYDIHDTSFDKREDADEVTAFWEAEAAECSRHVRYIVAELREVQS